MGVTSHAAVIFGVLCLQDRNLKMLHAQRPRITFLRGGRRADLAFQS
jgi:hypothetical protein